MKTTRLQPQLRFPEFSGKWENQTISKIANRITDGTHDTPKTIENGSMYITAIHVKDGFIDYDNCYFIKESDFTKILSRTNPEKGDLLMVNIGAGTATSALIISDNKFGLKNVALIKPNREIIEPSFFEQVQRMNSKRLKHQISAGGAQPFLSLKEIGKLKLNIPSLPEQQKIADYLSSIDEKINLLTEKKTELSRYKKAMMQQLFSQQIRFKPTNGHAEPVEAYPDWEEKRLGEVALIYDGTHQTPKYVEHGIPFYSVEQLTANDFSKTKYISEDVFKNESKRVVIEKGDVLMTRIGSIGKAKFIDWNVKASFYVSLALIKPLNNIIYGEFLTQLINNIDFQRELWRKSIHVAFPKKINLGEISTCALFLPCLEEQQKIADFLSAIDESIDKVNEQITQTQSFKKAMLQQMFV